MVISKSIGSWAFIIGLIVAAVIALLGVGTGTWAVYTLAILGLIVGLLNVADREVVRFLIASIAFIVTFNSLSSVVAPLPVIGDFLKSFFGLMVVFVAPAAAIVAIIALVSVSKN